jgi:4-amino-4-deoxy-L-arabinose transferase-like glycosyltransferase
MVVLAVAALALAVTWLQYESLEEYVDGFAVDGDAGITRETFDALILRSRLVAAGLAAVSLGLLLGGRRLDRPLAEVLSAVSGSLAAAPAELRLWAARTTAADLVALSIVLGIAVAVRIAFLDVALRYDEATTYVNYVSEPIHIGLSNYSEPNNHLFHTALAKLSVVAFGNGPTALRLPALLAGVAIVPLTFALGRLLYGRAAALVAAALVAVSSTLVEYSVNARGYTLVSLLTLIGLIAAVRAVEHDALAAWALVGVTNAIGLYAIPVMLYPAGGILVWLALSQLRGGRPLRRVVRRLAGCLLLTTIVTAVLYAPVFVASGPREVTSNEFVEPQSWTDFSSRLPGHAWDTLQTWVRDLPIVVGLALGVVLVASLLLTPRLSRFPIPPLLALVPFAALVVVAQRAIPFTRVWLFALPVAAVTVAGLIGYAGERLRRRDALVPAVAVVLAIGGAWAVLAADSPAESRETGGLLDAPAVADYLAGVVHPTDRILATGSDTILEYYLARAGVDDAGQLIYSAEPRRRTFVVVNVLGEQTLAQLVEQLAEPTRAFEPPRLVRRWSSALVYLLERRQAAPVEP